jgi:hypothetical protein
MNGTGTSSLPATPASRQNRTQGPSHTLDRRRPVHPFGAALTASQQIKTSAHIGGYTRVSQEQG